MEAIKAQNARHETLQSKIWPRVKISSWLVLHPLPGAEGILISI